MSLDAVTSYGGAAAVGIAATLAWVKIGPLLVAKLLGGNGKNGNGNGSNAALELKMQGVVERVATTVVAPIMASMTRVEAALTRMETAQSNMNSNISAILAADQARALSDVRGYGRHGD